MTTENAIVVGVATVVVLASLGIGGYLLYREANPPPPEPTSQETIPGWETFSATEEGGRDRITNEQQKFAAVAPEGWEATLPNSGTAAISKEDFPECSINVVLGSNDGYLSASGYVDQLNPPGPKPPTEEHRFAGTITVGGWPAAIVTILDKFGGEQKEVDIPRGNILFIVRMNMKGLVEDNKFGPHPRLSECEQALDDFLTGFQIQ